MSTLFEVRDHDREFYNRRLRGWLPERMVDIHTHIWRTEDRGRERTTDESKRSVSWPSRVARENPVEELLETNRLLLPAKEVTPLVFPTVPVGLNVDGMNRYAAQVSRENRVPALIFSNPRWSADELEQRIEEGGFVGIKSYLSMADENLGKNEITIYDYFPKHHLDLAARKKWIVMLHVPRDGRLKDPVNLEQMVEIDAAYPNASVVIAHVGRAYCDHDVGDAFRTLGKTRNLLFDFSANTNEKTFTALLDSVGPQRVLYGSDLPILRMRTRRLTDGEYYVNLVPKGMYGDVSGDRNMREVDGAEAESLTFFLYEELDAFRRASETAGLSRADLEDVFYNNAMRILKAAGWS